MKPIRVMVVDDHKLVRAGIRSLLQGIANVEVAGEAGSSQEALSLLPTLAPDVVLLDISMSGMSGLQATPLIRQQFPHVHVVIVTMNANEEYVLQALRAGASGYLLKDADPTELERALEAVMAGGTYLTPAVSTHVAAYVRRVGTEGSPLEKLTPRQREVLELIGRGLSTKEIARKLELSPKTVETHRAQLMEQLDIHDLAGLIRFAIRMGLAGSDS